MTCFSLTSPTHSSMDNFYTLFTDINTLEEYSTHPPCLDQELCADPILPPCYLLSTLQATFNNVLAIPISHESSSSCITRPPIKLIFFNLTDPAAHHCTTFVTKGPRLSMSEPLTPLRRNLTSTFPPNLSW